MGKKSGGVRIKQVGGMKPPSKAALASMMQPPKLEDFMVPPEEQIALPPPMNKKYQMFYPIHETFTMQTDTFQIIYPSYIDPTKTIQQGRRVPLHLLRGDDDDGNNSCGVPQITNSKMTTTDDRIVEINDVPTDKANNDTEVLLSPTMEEISQALQALHIRHVIQPFRCYPRCDPYENPGRCLVDIKTQKYKNKYELLIVLAKEIHKLPSRPPRIEQERIRQQELREQFKALTIIAESNTNTAGPTTNTGTIMTTTTNSHSATSTSSNKKKSGKKKK